jgi:hypothetical protein
MSDNSSSDISAVSLLGVAFVVLKLCGVIDWSWWLVTIPFWGGIALVAGVYAILIFVALPIKLFLNQLKRKRNEYWKEVEEVKQKPIPEVKQSKFMTKLNEAMEASKTARKESKK